MTYQNKLKLIVKCHYVNPSLWGFLTFPATCDSAQVDLSKATNVMDRWINAATRLLTNCVRCAPSPPPSAALPPRFQGLGHKLGDGAL